MASSAIRWKPLPIPYTNPCGVRAVYNPSNNSMERVYTQSAKPSRPRPSKFDALFMPTSYSHNTGTLDSGLGWVPATANCSGVVRSGLRPTHFRDEYGANIPPNVTAPSEMTDYIRNKLLEKIKNQKVNIGMLLTTYKQSATLCQGIAADLVGIYRDAKRGRLQSIRRRSGKLWLAYRYGITPAVNDLTGLLIETDNELNNRGLYLRVAARGGWQETSERVYGSTAVPRPVRTEGTVHGVCHVEFDNLELQRASQLGLTNLPFLLWDLTPWSFVADWVLDVGGYLDQLDTMIGVKRHAATITTRGFRQESLSLGGLQYTSTRRNTARAVLSLTPKLQWGSGLNLLRSADLVALASVRGSRTARSIRFG